MNYLKNFTDFFSSDQRQNITELSDSVKQDLQKAKLNFEKDRIVFDIEPVEVKEKEEETDQYRIFRYNGTFIYGFRKNGIFHKIPGDVSTETERKQNESGEIVFYVNKQTNKVDTIYETFAGNTWGKKQKKKRKHDFWKVAGTFFLVIIIGSSIYDDIKPGITSFMAEWSLREYKKDITVCVANTKEQMGDKKIIGLEYECAINKAATFYNENPERAIQLCMIYNPLFDIKLGREYSSINADDLYAQKNEQIVRTACKVSIEEELKKGN